MGMASMLNRYLIKSTFTVEKEFLINANSKEEAEAKIRNLNVTHHDQRESTVTRVRIKSNECVLDDSIREKHVK